MQDNRRRLLKAIGGAGAAVAAQPLISFPAIAQNVPVRVGIIAPKSGIVGTIGECGLRGTQFAVERINAAGGIAGRKVELIVEEETNPKDSIERLRKLVLQDKVDCVQGIVSSGVSLAMGAVAEEMKALLIFWDGTTQDGVKETMPKSALRVPQHRQRMRSGDGVAVGDQVLEGPVFDDRRHQPGLFIRPQQHGGVSGAAEEVQRRRSRSSPSSGRKSERST